MKKRILFSFACLAMVLATHTPLFAGGTAAQLLFFNVKPGAKAAFEKAVKQQMDARRAQSMSWRWLTWEYQSGELPRYCLASFGHSWSDFDLSEETARVEQNRLDAAAALSTQPPVAQYFEHLEEVSSFGTSTNSPAMGEVATYQLRYGKEAQFYAALCEFHRAMAGSGLRYEWFELRNGGETPQYMLLVPRDNWAALDLNDESFQDRLINVLGKRKAGKVFKQFTDAVKTCHRSAVRIRTDLSLIPGSPRKTP